MMVALKDLYLSTHGDGAREVVKDPKTGKETAIEHGGWKWEEDVKRFGERWDFELSPDFGLPPDLSGGKKIIYNQALAKIFFLFNPNFSINSSYSI
jgi:hypothetical protein